MQLVQDAKKKYLDACSSGNGDPPFDDLVGQLITDGYSTPFNNDSYFDALWLTHHMLKRTKSTIRIFTGSAADGFLTVLEKPFREALARLSLVGGSARAIVVNSKQNPTLMESLRQEFPVTFDYGLAVSKAPLNHFIVCDTKMVRVEDPHDEITDLSDASLIKARVNFNDHWNAELREAFFESIWKKIKVTRNVKLAA